MRKCECQYTLKVPEGNAFQVVFPVKTAEWKDGEQIVEVADVRALTDIAVKVDGEEWTAWDVEERGPILTFAADSLQRGVHNVEITANYFGVAIRAAYFECITIVQWSYESNVGAHIIDSPMVAEAAYIYVGITDDEELEALKQQYREATAACETARLQYEAAKEELEEKAEQLDDVAQQTTLVTSAATILEAIAGIHVDIPDNIATKDDVTAAKQAILDALSHISPTDPNSLALAQFFGVTLLEGYEFMQDTEVCDELEDIMQVIDPELTAEQAASITAEAMQIINDDEEQS
jgi:hypothetical protein